MLRQSVKTGERKDAYRRTYVCVNPDPALGPQTWRLAVPLEIGTKEEDDSIRYDFDGENPIILTQGPGLSPGREDVTTSLDISVLDDRAE